MHTHLHSLHAHFSLQNKMVKGMAAGGGGATPLDPLFTFRAHSGEVSCLKYFKLTQYEGGLASG